MVCLYLCPQQPDPEERETKWGDLQGFWDMVKLQVDNVDDMFAEIELLRDNGWQELPKIVSCGHCYLNLN